MLWSSNHYLSRLLLAGALTVLGLPQGDAEGLLPCGEAFYDAEKVRWADYFDLSLRGTVTDDFAVHLLRWRLSVSGPG